MTSNVRGAVATRAAPVTTQFQFGPWSLKAVKSHILESEGAARERFTVPLFLEQIYSTWPAESSIFKQLEIFCHVNLICCLIKIHSTTQQNTQTKTK